MTELEQFQSAIEALPGFLDPKGVQHHELKRGKHGRKIDFDAVIKNEELYKQWVKLNKKRIEERHPSYKNLFIIGVANGTTDLAFDVGKSLYNINATGLRTEKVNDHVRLTEIARLVLKDITRRKFVTAVILEDVGTTGFTSGNVALQATEECGVDEAEVVVSWQRTSSLEFLEEHNIAYSSLINSVLPTLSPEICQARGDCSKGVELIPYGQ